MKSSKIKDETYLSLFLRFLRFGLLAWGGPIAQIDMIRKELVEDERWISKKHFNRILGTYQFLPGPEANELCVYFGMKARGRIGALLAGLGFMLPGFVLMLLLSWFYVKYGIISPIFVALFYGFKPAVIALIGRGVHGMGRSVITNKWLFIIAILSAILEFLKIHFIINLLVAGFAYILLNKKKKFAVILLYAVLVVTALFLSLQISNENISANSQVFNIKKPFAHELLISGFKTGLLTFGGAYTAVPFMHHDAIEAGKWLTDKQFIDGLALSGILPAPFIIFTTFVGFLGDGILGAILVTIGVFFPAFAFTLIGYKYIEKVSRNKKINIFLDGLTAGVIGLIAVITLKLIPSSIIDFKTFGIFVFGLIILYKWKSKLAVPVVVLVSGVLGIIL